MVRKSNVDTPAPSSSVAFQHSPAWEGLFELLPGGELVRQGLEDNRKGVKTIPALLVQIGASRLRNLGLTVPKFVEDPESVLYDLLSEHDSDSAHSRYNALIRTLVSFERAAECAKK
ncbi:MAG: hypothetical protein HYY49_04770 [Ignavibacteriales bacterium]|nr:hypothetical protein [Ignavibacteriales bacterium]